MHFLHLMLEISPFPQVCLNLVLVLVSMSSQLHAMQNFQKNEKNGKNQHAYIYHYTNAFGSNSSTSCRYMQCRLFLFVHDHQRPTQLKTKQSQQSYTKFGSANQAQSHAGMMQSAPQELAPFCCIMEKVRHEVRNADCHEY